MWKFSFMCGKKWSHNDIVIMVDTGPVTSDPHFLNLNENST